MSNLTAWARACTLFSAMTLLGACGSAISLKPTTVASSAEVAQQHGVAAVNVGIADSMPADRTQMLEQAQAPQQLQQAVLTSFANSGKLNAQGVTLDIQIHAYRISNWGPSRMGVQVNVRDASGDVVETFERQSATTRGGSTRSRTERMAQDLVQKIVDET